MKKTDIELKIEALRLRAEFQKKGIRNVREWIRQFHPKKVPTQQEYYYFIYGQKANAELCEVLADILNIIK